MPLIVKYSLKRAIINYLRQVSVVREVVESSFYNSDLNKDVMFCTLIDHRSNSGQNVTHGSSLFQAFIAVRSKESDEK